MRRVCQCLVVVLMLAATALAAANDTLPIRLHPKNPRYFEWRGEAIALVTSPEHYGAVLNLDFDWHRYLAMPKIIGYDESGFAGRADATYRRQAWNFLLSGGGLFNSLDYRFTVGHENGDDVTNRVPGGGSLTLRKVLSGFLHSFDLAKLQPDRDFVKASPPGVVTRVLSALGEAYALYMEGRSPSRPF
jgi:hypothetical protein